MNPNEYQKLAARTECDQIRSRERIISRDSVTQYSLIPTRLLHSCIGICKEGGELGEALQDCYYYGKPLDEVNIKEELGDVMWHVAQACNTLGLSLEDVMEANIAKLMKRFPDKYSDEHAAEENRDRVAERKIVAKTVDDLLARQLARNNDYLCPNCKYLINDEVMKNMLSGKTITGRCPECQRDFTLEEIDLG